jgi:tetratricopeptide (TPR) repeat protein
MKESVMSTSLLEAKLAANPGSPLFARLAASYLREGKTQQALELCLAGLKTFPEYATGHLVLGRCYEALGRNIEAMLEYRRTLKAVPDNPLVQRLMRDVERREQEAFRAFAEERARKLKERKESLTFDQYIEEEAAENESTVDFLLRRLKDTKRAPSDVHSQESTEQGRPAAYGSAKIVTATLAEIYAKQGEYKEAIEAYRKLLDQRPVEAERYAKRIAQLEEMMQQGEHKP